MEPFVVIGNSELASRLARTLTAPWSTHIESDVGAKCIVWVRDGHDWPNDLLVQHTLRQQGAPWVHVWREADEIWIGPWQQGERPGCIACLRHRLRSTSANRVAFDWQDRQRVDAAPLLTLPQTLTMLAALLQAAAGSGDTVMCLSLKDLSLIRHPITPVSDCSVCGQLPIDTADAISYPAASLPKEDPQAFRTAKVPPDIGRLRDRFVDHRTGVILNELRHPPTGWFPVSEAKLVLTASSTREPGLGREFDYATADRVAILEALERCAGINPQAKSPGVEGTYRELADRAIDPSDLILHHSDGYGDAGFHLTAYTPDLRLRWVWAYSFTLGRPCLVPEQAVYYGGAPGARILWESSSGCALGSSFTEAVFHGLLELIERDGFMVTWYGRLPVPRLHLDDVADIRLRDVMDRVERRGYRVDAFNLTTDIRLPTVGVVIWNPRDDGPFASVSAGAHPDPLKAFKAGLMEAAYLVPHMEALYQEQPLDRSLLDPDQVRSMADHRSLYLLPETRSRFAFLLAAGRQQRFAEAWPEAWPLQTDLVADLTHLVGLVRAAGLDVLAVDQTPPELRAMGLAAVRVLVPGALPLTFGHKLRRVNERRLQTASSAMGYGAPAEVNLDPHPFC